MKSRFLFFLAGALLCSAVGAARAQTQPAQPQEFVLPSAAPSGLTSNDSIPIRYFPVALAAQAKAPAVILLHHLGSSGDDKRYNTFAAGLNRAGIAAVIMTLPYHGRRRTPGRAANTYFVGEAAKVAQAFGQSSSDVSTVVTWLQQRPEIAANRIGGTGVSLGAFVLHIVMGRDERIRAGVAALGAGSLADIFVTTAEGKHAPTATDIETLRPVEPLASADRNRPRRVLMIQAARDEVVPPRYSQKLWEALGRPPIEWADVNHSGLVFSLKSVVKTAVAYLTASLGDNPDDLSRVPRLRSIPIRVGIQSGLDTRLTPTVQAQLFAVGTRNHMALLHGDVGVGLRGPFVGMAATINRNFDVGLGRRLFGNDFRPYVSYHKNF